MSRRTVLGVALAALGAFCAPAVASAVPIPDSVVGFDGAPAVVGQSAATIYAADPGLVFGPTPSPPVGSIPFRTACGIYVSATAGAPSAPNAGALACGGGEFPSPPVLYGTFTRATRTRLSLKVGDSSASGHLMKLTAYDGDGLVVGTDGPTRATVGGTSLSVTGGQPEIASFLLEETGSDTRGGVWVDDITVDNPPVPGHPAFSVQRTGSGSTYLTQGAPASTVDLSLYRVNGSDGNVAYGVSGLPTGVDATQVPSVNGVGIALSASPEAPVTVGDQDVTVTVTAAPQDAGAGTRNQVVTFDVRVAPALVLSARGVRSTPVPSCNTVLLDYGIVDYAGPASWVVSGLPSGVTATINGTAAGSASAVTGYGTVRLGFTTTTPVTGNPVVHVGLVGSTFFTSIFPSHAGHYGQSQAIALTQAAGLTVSPSSGRTPQRLGPGTSVTVSGDHLCAGPAARVRFGNDQALAPIASATRDGNSVTAVVPRNATSGTISLVPDVAAPSVRMDGPTFTVDSYRNTTGYSFHNYVPKLTMGQATAAFGYDATHLTIDPCPIFDCPITTPIPDPWTMILLAVANGTMGKSDGGGACFGFSRTSQQLRRGDRALRDFSPAGASNAFALDGPNGPAGPVQEYINSGQLSLLSNEYIPFYLAHATANTIAATPGTIRGEVTRYLQNGDDPQISLRDGGSLTKMHVVVAYDIEQDPNSTNPGDYYIDVYDSNQQFLQPGAGGDETAADGASHAMRLAASRIHVRNDGFWELPSSNFSASSLGNVVVSGYDNPPRQPSELTLGGLARQGLVLLLGSDVASLLPRQTGTGRAAPTTIPSATDQISAGGRTLYSKPGVINTDPKTALHATPWVPPTGGNSDVEGFILGAGAGADYTVALSSRETTTETRTVLGGGFMGRITTTLGQGVANKLTVQPGQRSIGFSTQGPAVPLSTEVVGRAADGSTRTVTTRSTVSSGGGDTVSLGAGGSAVSIVHRGAATNVAVTLSWVGTSGPPQAVTAQVRMAANATLQLAPSNWARLADRAIRVTDGARHGRLKVKAVHASGTRLSGLKLVRSEKRLTAKIVARAPRRLESGTAIVAWELARSGKVLARHSAPLTRGGRTRLGWRLPAGARKGDRLNVVVVTVLRRGGVFSSTTSRLQRRL